MATSGGNQLGPGSELEDVLTQCLEELINEHDKETVKSALETLLKITNNVIQHSGEEKYRRIKTENKTFHEKVWCLSEAQQFLMVCGWIETADGAIVLPADVDVNLAKHVLHNKLSVTQSSSCSRNEKDKTLTEKEKTIQEEQRLLREKLKHEKQERERIKAQIRADRENIKAREIRDSKAKKLQGDGQMTKFEDIGVDLGASGGG